MDRTSLHKIKEERNKYSSLVVFIGSNTPWHGIEKIVEIATKNPSIGFVIIGDYEIKTTLSNIIMLGKQNMSTIPLILNYCSFGFGPFSLSKKNMKEACPLKTREYLYFGVPIIVNYYDSAYDFEDLQLYFGLNHSEKSF